MLTMSPHRLFVISDLHIGGEYAPANEASGRCSKTEQNQTSVFEFHGTTTKLK
jgi:hypothetical protein